MINMRPKPILQLTMLNKLKVIIETISKNCKKKKKSMDKKC